MGPSLCLVATVLIVGSPAAVETQAKTPESRKKSSDGIYAVRRESLKEQDLLPLGEGELLLVHHHRPLKKEEKEPPRFLVVPSAPDVELDLVGEPKAVKEGTEVVRIFVKLLPKAATALERLTRDHLGGQIAIVLGGEVVTMHKVREVIKGGDAQITRCTAGTARYLLDQLQAHRSVVRGNVGRHLDELFTRAGGDKFAGVVLVARGERPLLLKGYGLANREDRTPTRPGTAYCIGSITKPFTATAILLLEQAGKLKASDPIARFFDDIPEDKRTITLHHLMTHTAGLHEYHDRPGEGGDFAALTRKEAVRRILGQKLRFKPGAKVSYSNSGFTLLAAVVEKASGQTFERVLHRQVFAPAGMKQTGFFGEKRWASALVARGYGERKRGANSPPDWPGVTWALKGSGGIVTTVGDLHKFALALRGERLLTRAAKERAYRAHVPLGEGGLGAGYGWAVMPTPQKTFVLRHGGGSDFGFHSAVWFNPQEEVFIAFLSNQPRPHGLREVFLQAAKLARSADD
jgi:CubicO group peptidase (beta-lactamase class C family)